MEFETEIKHLTQELLGSFDSRTKAVADIRSNTMNEMQADQTARQAAAAEQQQHLEQHMDQLRSHVMEMRDHAMQQMSDMRSANISMAVAQQQRLAQQSTAMKQDTADFVTRTSTARAEMSQRQRQMLNQHLAHVRQTNAAFMERTRATRQQITAKEQQELKHYMAVLRDDVGTMRSDTAKFVAEVNQAHAAMSDAQQEKLASARAQLKADTLSMRQSIQAVEATLRADQTAAQSEWAHFTHTMAGLRTVEVAEPTPEPVATMPAPEPVVAQVPVTMPEPEPASVQPFPAFTTPVTDENEDEKKKMI